MNDEKPAAAPHVAARSSVSAATNAFFTGAIVGRDGVKKIDQSVTPRYSCS